MPRAQHLFTSESVSEGHPDKICDQISDAIVDAYIKRAPQARLAIETLAASNLIVIAGEIGGVDPQGKPVIPHADTIEDVARGVIRRIGYEQEHFHWKKAAVQQHLQAQSQDIAQGVDAKGNKDEGAGDQGIMFGYACDETDALMPAPIFYAHRIVQALAEARHKGRFSGLGPDAKSQITLLYQKGQPQRAEKVVVSTQHDEAVSQDDLRALVKTLVTEVLPDGWMCAEKNLHVNPTGRFVRGGPDGDAGLTGRKIIVDTYGGAAPHGGGAFSGKDPTKVDRSAAYAARYLAKNVVAAGLARQCTIQLSYAIGLSEPLSLYADLHEDAEIKPEALEKALARVMDLTPRGIRTHLGLNKPIYERTASYGHFGRKPHPDGGFSWEKTDLTDALINALR